MLLSTLQPMHKLCNRYVTWLKHSNKCIFKILRWPRAMVWIKVRVTAAHVQCTDPNLQRWNPSEYQTWIPYTGRRNREHGHREAHSERSFPRILLLPFCTHPETYQTPKMWPNLFNIVWRGRGPRRLLRHAEKGPSYHILSIRRRNWNGCVNFSPWSCRALQSLGLTILSNKFWLEIICRF